MNNQKLEKKFILGEKEEIPGTDGLASVIFSDSVMYHVHLIGKEEEVRVKSYHNLAEARKLVKSFYLYPFFAKALYEDFRSVKK